MVVDTNGDSGGARLAESRGSSDTARCGGWNPRAVRNWARMRSVEATDRDADPSTPATGSSRYRIRLATAIDWPSRSIVERRVIDD